MTWRAGRHIKELRNKRAGLCRRIREGEDGYIIKNFELRRSYWWARDIVVRRPIGCNIITWNHTREHASRLYSLVTEHP